MNLDWLTKLGSARGSGVITAIMVAVIGLYLATQRQPFDVISFTSACLLYAGYLVLFIKNTEDRPNHSDQTQSFLVVLQFATIIGLFFSLPYTFNAILLSIWSGHLVYYFRLSLALAFLPVLAVVFYGVFSFYWQQQHVHLTAILYTMLTMFTVVMVDAVRKESIAKEESQQLYRELLAAQRLLREATKQSERVRIARNIHDLVGHHLTALTINLQVALHKTDGEAKQQVEKSYAIAKLLLSDVREAVTEIREKSNIELRESLHAIVDSIPRLKVDLQLDEQLQIQDVEIADTIIKCIQESLTNSLKHSNSDQLIIRIFTAKKDLHITIHDNGHANANFIAGNGLKGIQERISHLHGKVIFNADQTGFSTEIAIPMTLG